VPDWRHVKGVQQTNTSLTHPNRETRHTSLTLPSWEKNTNWRSQRATPLGTTPPTVLIFVRVYSLSHTVSPTVELNWRSHVQRQQGTTPPCAATTWRKLALPVGAPTKNNAFHCAHFCTFVLIFAHCLPHGGVKLALPCSTTTGNNVAMFNDNMAQTGTPSGRSH
jgi:hypothetical protein